jgi:hypothetical protein
MLDKYEYVYLSTLLLSNGDLEKVSEVSYKKITVQCHRVKITTVVRGNIYVYMMMYMPIYARI